MFIRVVGCFLSAVPTKAATLRESEQVFIGGEGNFKDVILHGFRGVNTDRFTTKLTEDFVLNAVIGGDTTTELNVLPTFFFLVANFQPSFYRDQTRLLIMVWCYPMLIACTAMSNDRLILQACSSEGIPPFIYKVVHFQICFFIILKTIIRGFLTEEIAFGMVTTGVLAMD